MNIGEKIDIEALRASFQPGIFYIGCSQFLLMFDPFGVINPWIKILNNKSNNSTTQLEKLIYSELDLCLNLLISSLQLTNQTNCKAVPRGTIRDLTTQQLNLKS